MSERTRRSRQLLALVLLFPLAVACGEAEPEPELHEPMEMERGPAMEPMMDRTVELHPVNDSGVSGVAELMHSNNQVVVVLELEGLPGEGGYAAHIHVGSCADGGPVGAPLDPVVGLADGTGTSTTTIDAGDLSRSDPHFIQVHGEAGTPIACGDVEGHGD
jgi:hypothetical protein